MKVFFSSLTHGPPRNISYRLPEYAAERSSHRIGFDYPSIGTSLGRFTHPPVKTVQDRPRPSGMTCVLATNL